MSNETSLYGWKNAELAEVEENIKAELKLKFNRISNIGNVNQINIMNNNGNENSIKKNMFKNGQENQEQVNSLMYKENHTGNEKF